MKTAKTTQLSAASLPRSQSTPLRVLLAGKSGAMNSPGGGEIQMLALADALPAAGVDARLWQLEETLPAGTDCLHLFGSLPEHLPLVEAAQADFEGQKNFAPFLRLYLEGNPLSDAAKNEQLASLKEAGVRIEN